MVEKKLSNQAIVTLCIGEKYNKLSNITCPIMHEYATRIGSDFVIIDSPKLDFGSGHYEKFQLYDLLNTYERIAFLDLDILIAPNCPNIFSMIPKSHFGAFDTSNYSNIHVKAINLIQDKLGDIGWENVYFNSGVMIFSREHQEVFNPSNGLLKKCSLLDHKEQSEVFFFDQTLINYNVKRLKIPFYDVSYKFNHTTAPGNSHERFKSFIIHYPGKGHRRGGKVQQIEKDAFVIKNNYLFTIVSNFPHFNYILDRI